MTVSDSDSTEIPNGGFIVNDPDLKKRGRRTRKKEVKYAISSDEEEDVAISKRKTRARPSLKRRKSHSKADAAEDEDADQDFKVAEVDDDEDEDDDIIVISGTKAERSGSSQFDAIELDDEELDEIVVDDDDIPLSEKTKLAKKRPLLQIRNPVRRNHQRSKYPTLQG